MAAESATYISQLDAAAPAANAQVSEGDDHLRLLKAVLKAQFPNLGEAAITVSAQVINRLVGLSANIVDLLAAKAPLDSPLFTGNARAPTPNISDNSNKIATTSFVNAIAMAGVPPEVIEQLQELEAALIIINGLGSAAFEDAGTSEGELMPVGSFGLGAASFSVFIGDCNDLDITEYARLVDGTTAVNAPHEDEESFVSTWSNGSGGRIQLAFCTSSSLDPVWRRSATDGSGYGAWAALGSGGVAGVTSNGTTFAGGTITIDVQAAQYTYGALTSNSTFTFNNIPAAGYYEWRLEIANPSTRTWAFTNTINWQGYSAKPPLAATGSTVIQFWVRDFGTTAKIFARVLSWGSAI